MANWSCVMSKAEVDGTGLNVNIKITLTATNSLTQEIQNREYTAGQWTQQQVVTLATQLIASLNARDAAMVVAQAAVSNQTVLATG